MFSFASATPNGPLSARQPVSPSARVVGQQAALAAAENADLVVVCAATTSQENADRPLPRLEDLGRVRQFVRQVPPQFEC